MKVRGTHKKVYLAGLSVIICAAALMVYMGINTIADGGRSIFLSMEKELALQSLSFLYPGMVYPQTDEEPLGTRLLQQACYHILPLAGYIQEGGEQNLYATQMENRLSEEEIEEILRKEAADENHVDENGEVTYSEGAVQENETVIADRVLEQLKQENQTSEAASGTVVSEPVENQQVIGQEYDMELLSYDFLINHFYIVDSTTNISEEQLNAEELLAKDMTMAQDPSVPQILIYHTHSQEDFIDSVKGDSSTTIVGVGNHLTKLLQEKGYNVIHDTTEFDLVDGKLDRNKAYSMALPKVEKILKENPTIEVVIDLHRDGIDGSKMVTDVNGKPTAKLMFFNGLSYTNKNGAIEYLKNPYIKDNLAFSLKLQLEAAKYFPGATRKIYLKGYRYNLHVRPRALLVESGSQNNTVEEQMNAMEVLADVLHKVLSAKE